VPRPHPTGGTTQSGHFTVPAGAAEAAIRPDNTPLEGGTHTVEAPRSIGSRRGRSSSQKNAPRGRHYTVGTFKNIGGDGRKRGRSGWGGSFDKEGISTRLHTSPLRTPDDPTPSLHHDGFPKQVRVQQLRLSRETAESDNTCGMSAGTLHGSERRCSCAGITLLPLVHTSSAMWLLRCCRSYIGRSLDKLPSRIIFRTFPTKHRHLKPAHIQQPHGIRNTISAIWSAT